MKFFWRALLLGGRTAHCLVCIGQRGKLAIYFVGFNTGSPLIGQYPLVPNAYGTVFATASTNVEDLTIAGQSLYWIDGNDVMTANLDGSGLSVLRQFGYTPASIAVYDPTSQTVPEPASVSLVTMSLVLLLDMMVAV